MTDRTEPTDETPESPSRRTIKVTDKRRVTATPPSDEKFTPTGDVGEAEAGSEKASARSPDPAEAQGGQRRAASQEPADAHQADLEAARAEAAEYLDHLRRLKAEFDNYRKRVLKEQTKAVEFATEPLMNRLLEVLDEFELAVMAAEAKPEFERFRRGVEMVYGKLNEILRSEGLERIDAVDQPFDPEVHEALLQVDDEGDGEPYVADVLRNGYRLKGRVLRPAGVKVARR